MAMKRLQELILRKRGPLSLTGRAWGVVLRRTWRAVLDDRISLVAAGSAFFALLAIVPAITAIVSIWALFADPNALADQVALVDRILPSAAAAIVIEQMRRIAATASGSLGWGAVLSFALMLWSANQGTRAFMDAFNAVYRTREERGFLAVNLYSLLLTGVGVALAGVALALVVGLPAFFTAIGFASEGPSGVGLLRWPILLVSVFAFYALLGRFAPSRKPRAPWRWLWPGAAASALAWLIASALFSLYVGHFNNYNAVYGSLGAIVILLLWIYLSIFVGLIGAKMNAELERETFVDPVVATPPKAENANAQTSATPEPAAHLGPQIE